MGTKKIAVPSQGDAKALAFESNETRGILGGDYCAKGNAALES